MKRLHIPVGGRSDLYRISLHCRCGRSQIVEIPKVLASGNVGHVCVQCRALFTLRLVPETKKWDIRREPDAPFVMV